MTGKLLTTFILIGTFVAAATSGAATMHQSIPGTTQNIPAVANYKTTGELMAGMEVTAFFSNAADETVSWAATGNPDEGAAVGATGDWSVVQTGDTFLNSWKLQYNQTGKGRLTGLRFDGLAAGVVENSVLFDREKDFSGDTTVAQALKKGKILSQVHTRIQPGSTSWRPMRTRSNSTPMRLAPEAICSAFLTSAFIPGMA